jgi:hypothetical protein
MATLLQQANAREAALLTQLSDMAQALNTLQLQQASRDEDLVDHLNKSRLSSERQSQDSIYREQEYLTRIQELQERGSAEQIALAQTQSEKISTLVQQVSAHEEALLTQLNGMAQALNEIPTTQRSGLDDAHQRLTSALLADIGMRASAFADQLTQASHALAHQMHEQDTREIQQFQDLRSALVELRTLQRDANTLAELQTTANISQFQETSSLYRTLETELRNSISASLNNEEDTAKALSISREELEKLQTSLIWRSTSIIRWAGKKLLTMRSGKLE